MNFGVRRSTFGVRFGAVRTSAFNVWRLRSLWRNDLLFFFN
jgi:hypothetical protein